MSVEQEWKRLQELYAAMSDAELLELAGAKAGLTEVARQAIEGELSMRGLTEVAEEQASVAEDDVDLPEAEDDPSLIELMTFQIAADAERALHALDDNGIPVKMEPAMRRMVEGGPLVKTNWLTIFVETERKQDAVAVLRERMGLFPVLAPEEMDDDAHEPSGEDEVGIVGSFDTAADIALVKQALTEAGIWFEAEDDSDDRSHWTLIMAKAGDVDRAMDVVAAAFAEE